MGDVGRIGVRSTELLRISGKSLLISATGCGIVGIISKSDRQPMLRRPQPPQSLRRNASYAPDAGAGASLRRVASYAQASQERSPQGCCKCRWRQLRCERPRYGNVGGGFAQSRVRLCTERQRVTAIGQRPLAGPITKT